MEINISRSNNLTVISVSGRMDAVTAPEFEKSLSELISKGEKRFLINFSGLDYISSAGLRSILAAAKQLKTENGEIFFTGISGSVEEVFNISGFHSIFRIFKDEESALKKV